MSGTVLLFLLAIPAFAAPDKLVLLDGQGREETIAAIDSQGKLTRPAATSPLALADLRRIERAIQLPEKPPDAACDVFLAGGGRIRAQNVEYQNERFTIRWALGEATSLPAAAVRAVRLATAPDLPPGTLWPAFDTALHQEQLVRDTLFALVEQSVQQVSGGLQAVGAEEVQFIYNDAERKIRRAKVYGLVLAHRGPPPDLGGQCLVQCTDGSAFWAAVAGLAEGKLALRLEGSGELTIPWDSVRRLDVRSRNLVFLSDLDPADVLQEPIVTYAGPWQRDRSVTGTPLTLGKAVFDKGLGVHSRAKLAYRMPGDFPIFAATIGIDASSEGRGNCEFIVLADGKELYRRAMRGTDPAETVRLNVAGAQRLTLLVDWGEDLDLGDRADWCDARLIKESEGK